MISISNAENVLKQYYLDVVKEQANSNVSPFFNAITRTSENICGKEVKLVIVKEGNQNVAGASEEGSIFASTSGNRYYNISLPLKNMYGSFEITDKLIRASSSSVGAMVGVLNAEMEGLINSAKSVFARMLFGDGDGLCCRIIKRVANGLFLVDSPKLALQGTFAKIRTLDGKETTIKVDGVDLENSTVLLADNISSLNVEGARICYNVVEGTEILGLASIFDGDKLYGYSKETEPYFRPNVSTIQKDKLTEYALMKMIDDISESGGRTNMIICSHATRRRIAALMSASRRIVNTTDVAAGVSSVLINDVPVYADKHCPEDRIYFLNTDDFVLNQLCDWSWLEDDKGGILNPVAKKAAFTATLVKYAELVCRRPCGQGLIKLALPEPEEETEAQG